MTTAAKFYLTTFIPLDKIVEYQQTQDVELLRHMPIATDESIDYIGLEMHKSGMVLMGLETEQDLLAKLALIEDFKKTVKI